MFAPDQIVLCLMQEIETKFICTNPYFFLAAMVMAWLALASNRSSDVKCVMSSWRSSLR